MRLAALAGIRVFVTGGLGGVHRGAETSFDISADLTELGQTDVAVISAGVKSILDIGLTLESLETLGVPVVVVGSDEFPSFYSRERGHGAPMRVDTADELAAMMQAKWSLGLSGGIAVTNPVPVEDEIPAAEIGVLIDQALAECDQRVATQPDRVAIGQVPPAVAVEQRRVVGIEQIDEGYPGLDVVVLVDGAATLEPNRRRADGLALIAAVDAVAERGAELAREHPRALEQPGQAPTGVDHARGDDGPGRAAVDAPLARAATVGDGCGCHG
jgi:hypothetical protein